MSKKTFLVWVILLIFGFTSMPEISSASESKQAGKTEFTKKKPRKKGTKNRKNKKKKRSSKKRKSGGKKKYSKKKKYTKKKKYGKKKRSKRKRYYAPPTNQGSVEYRNYKRNSDADNNGSELNIDRIAPQKEIRKEPKKEGEN